MALTFSRRLGGAGLALMLLSPVLHAQSDTPEAPLTAPAERAYDLPAQPLR